MKLQKRLFIIMKGKAEGRAKERNEIITKLLTSDMSEEEIKMILG